MNQQEKARKDFFDAEKALTGYEFGELCQLASRRNTNIPDIVRRVKAETIELSAGALQARLEQIAAETKTQAWRP